MNEPDWCYEQWALSCDHMWWLIGNNGTSHPLFEGLAMWREEKNKKKKWFDGHVGEDVKNNNDLVVGVITMGIQSPVSIDIKSERWLQCCPWCELWCCFVYEMKLNSYVFFRSFWHKLKIQSQERTHNTTNLGEPAQPKWNHEIMSICGL